MNRCFALLLFFLIPFYSMAHKKMSDTCLFALAGDSDIANLAKIIQLDNLIALNSAKTIYVSAVRIKSDKSILFRECYSLSSIEMIDFNGKLRKLDNKLMRIDTTILFNKVGNSNTVIYYSYNATSGDYHADGQVLIFKFNDKYIIGYSFDGCDLVAVLTKLINKYFDFKEEEVRGQFISILNTLPSSNKRLKD